MLHIALIELQVLFDGAFRDPIKLGDVKSFGFVLHGWIVTQGYDVGMNERLGQRRLIVLGLLLVLTVLIWVADSSDALVLGRPVCDTRYLCVVFLNVGQGDATFIQSPSGRQMLIDGGRDSSVLRELGSVMGFFDKDIDYVLATHPDADHVGGLTDVLERYQVANVIRTENESDTPVWERTEELIKEEGVPVHFARRGQSYDLGGGVKLQILFPDIDPSELESNTASIIAKLTYGENSFMLTGDSPKAIEEYLVLIEGEHLESDVLKIGHHGSRTSTAELFLDHISPIYAVISAGKDNQYGHPHVEVTDLLFNAGVKMFNTAEDGRVTFWSDGETVGVR